MIVHDRSSRLRLPICVALFLGYGLAYGQHLAPLPPHRGVGTPAKASPVSRYIDPSLQHLPQSPRWLQALRPPMITSCSGRTKLVDLGRLAPPCAALGARCGNAHDSIHLSLRAAEAFHTRCDGQEARTKAILAHPASRPATITARAVAPITQMLAAEVVPPATVLEETLRFAEARVVRLPNVKSAEEWDAQSRLLRKDVLDKIIFRGEAARWRDADLKVEWLDSIPSTAPVAASPGYSIRKLRFEALPGLWIPALLYVPDRLEGTVPVSLALNGHVKGGKAVEYKQIRCINQAKRGMMVLNVEWFGTGQLRTDGLAHSRANQLDLCGASAVAPFYLSLRRSLDILLSQPNADPSRVAVSGLSGGGWQTILIGAIDERVTLVNPVAGYSSFLTRAREATDLGDTEQMPCDLAAVADYLHLTAMLSPRPALLTYNRMDTCCFRSDHALQPLVDGAQPIFSLYGASGNLRWHINEDPGTHNYDRDNREAFYQMLAEHFFSGRTFDWHEIPCLDEIKTVEQLSVPLPAHNETFNSVARTLMANLPRHGSGCDKLREIIHYRQYENIEVNRLASIHNDGLRSTSIWFRLGKDWSVPATQFVREDSLGVTLVVADAGRKTVAEHVQRLVDQGERVIAIDPFLVGSAAIPTHNWLYALLIGAVGERPLGIQAGQIGTIARWAQTINGQKPVSLLAIGPRTSTSALVAAAIEINAIGSIELHNPLLSLKELIEQNRVVNDLPELFCQDLLEYFDVKDIAALVAPRPVRGL